METDRRRIDVGRWIRQELFLGALLPTMIGVAGVLAAVIGATQPDTVGIRVVVGIVAALFLAVGSGLYFWLFAHPPVAWLDCGADSVAFAGRRGAAWSVGWDETTEVALVRTRLGWRWATGTGGRIGAPLPVFPRYHLLLTVTATATARDEVRDALLGPRNHTRILDVDLGVPGTTARDVQRTLAGRLTRPDVVRVEPGNRWNPGPSLLSAGRPDQSRPRPPST